MLSYSKIDVGRTGHVDVGRGQFVDDETGCVGVYAIVGGLHDVSTIVVVSVQIEILLRASNDPGNRVPYPPLARAVGALDEHKACTCCEAAIYALCRD